MSTATDQPLADLLIDLRACGDAVAWAAEQKDYASAYATCPSAGWLLWIAARLGVDRLRRDAAIAAIDAAAADARRRTLARCADLVRASIPYSVIADALERYRRDNAD